jgi:hypothetical protein
VPGQGGPGESRGARPMVDTSLPSDTTVPTATTVPSD